MECPSTNEVLERLEGRLSSSRAAALDAHAEDCEECHALLAEAARGLGRLADDTVELAPTVPDGELAAFSSVEVASGASISRYVVRGVLGAGGMGVVYEALDPELDRHVALKLLRRRTADHELPKARLLREAKAMARLQHPNVVTVFDAGEHEGHVFVAMEKVDGRTLSRWLAEGRRSWLEVVRVFLEAGRGLAAAHAVGLVHRDFKPDNVLVGSDGRVRVTDFGLAQDGGRIRGSAALATSTFSQSSALAGTPAYMAPEQILGQPTDARADQFAFCVSLYQALFGERPFTGRTFDELVETIGRAELQRAPAGTRVPPRIFELLLKGLQRRPDDRFASLDALLMQLERASAPRRVVPQLAGAAALAVLGGAAWLSLRPKEPAVPRVAPPAAQLAAFAVEPPASAAPSLTAAQLSVETAQPCDLYVDGKPSGRAPSSGVAVAPGSHQLICRTALKSEARATVQVRSTETATAHFKFPAGRLALWVLPWADVEIDGKRVGTTPLAPVPLGEGTHQVTLVMEGKKLTRTVVVRSGETETLRVDMRSGAAGRSGAQR
jgi:hypothetical protein